MSKSITENSLAVKIANWKKLTLPNCCCCLKLKTGAIIIGILILLSSISNLFHSNGIFFIDLIYRAIVVVRILVTAGLLYGIFLKKLILVMAFDITYAICLILEFILSIIILIYTLFFSSYYDSLLDDIKEHGIDKSTMRASAIMYSCFTLLILITIYTYIWACVHSYYVEEFENVVAEEKARELENNN